MDFAVSSTIFQAVTVPNRGHVVKGAVAMSARDSCKVETGDLSTARVECHGLAVLAVNVLIVALVAQFIHTSWMP